MARSDWMRVPVPAVMRPHMAEGTQMWQRNVSDWRHLSAIVAVEGDRWHMSLSCRTNEIEPQPARLPTWEELRDARYDLLPHDLTMAMLLPPLDEYLNLHPTTFHLHELAPDDAERMRPPDPDLRGWRETRPHMEPS